VIYLILFLKNNFLLYKGLKLAYFTYSKIKFLNNYPFLFYFLKINFKLNPVIKITITSQIIIQTELGNKVENFAMSELGQILKSSIM
jgi:hypothetical protein